MLAQSVSLREFVCTLGVVSRQIDQRPRAGKPQNTIHCIDGYASSRGNSVRRPLDEETLAVARIASQEESGILSVHYNRDVPGSMARCGHNQNIACFCDPVSSLKWTESLGRKSNRLRAKPLGPPVGQVT